MGGRENERKCSFDQPLEYLEDFTGVSFINI